MYEIVSHFYDILVYSVHLPINDPRPNLFTSKHIRRRQIDIENNKVKEPENEEAKKIETKMQSNDYTKIKMKTR